MAGQRKSPFHLSIEELEQELLARSAQVPVERLFQFSDPDGTTTRHTIMGRLKEQHQSPPALNTTLAEVTTMDLAKILVFKTRPGMDCTRGSASEELLDYYDIADSSIIKNTLAVAAICSQDALSAKGPNSVTLKTKNYGKTFNLCELEPFRDQPIAAATLGTGFLVAEDILATTADWIDNIQLTDLCILFGYAMTDMASPVLSFANESIYRAVSVIRRTATPQGVDCVLLKLDRKVKNYKKMALSINNIEVDQEIYVLGHPLGLPLKFAVGFSVTDTQGHYFTADLSIYSAHNGSPVFDCNTHEVIGMVADSYQPDFRWTGNGWLSINNPNDKKITCIRISENFLGF